MSNWLFALQLLPLLTNLITMAEKLLGDGEGVKKKAFVKDGVEQTIKAISSVSTGGQKETWQNIELFYEPLSGLIDSLAGLLFPSKNKDK